jgi:hypothetical protein
MATRGHAALHDGTVATQRPCDGLPTAHAASRSCSACYDGTPRRHVGVGRQHLDAAGGRWNRRHRNLRDGMVHDSARGVAVVFGGYDGRSARRHVGVGTATRGCRAQRRPLGRYGLRDVLRDTARGITVLFGGFDAALSGTRGSGTAASWTPRGSGAPSPRAWHSMAHDVCAGFTVPVRRRRKARAMARPGSGTAAHLDPARGAADPRRAPRHSVAYDGGRAASTISSGRRTALRR